MIEGFDHVQVAAPRGCEAEARRFFGGLLGLVEVEKPQALLARGGVWFQAGNQQLHVGVEEPFAPARKAHPALRVRPGALDELAARLQAAGASVYWDEALDEDRRFYSEDPWGNRIELLASRQSLARRGAGTTVRRCQEADVPAVLGLWEQARSDHASTPDRLDDVKRLVAGSPAALLVAERNGEIVGALIAAWDGWRGNMYRLAVRDGHRRKGVGLALVRAGEDYLRQCDVRRVTALVAFADQVAEGFWETAGYPLDREIGRRVRNL